MSASIIAPYDPAMYDVRSTTRIPAKGPEPVAKRTASAMSALRTRSPPGGAGRVRGDPDQQRFTTTRSRHAKPQPEAATRNHNTNPPRMSGRSPGHENGLTP